MMVWVLVVTVYFSHGSLGDSVLKLPAEVSYPTPERCAAVGQVIEGWLTQDGATVEWKCVKIEKEHDDQTHPRG